MKSFYLFAFALVLIGVIIYNATAETPKPKIHITCWVEGSPHSVRTSGSSITITVVPNQATTIGVDGEPDKQSAMWGRTMCTGVAA